MPRWLHHTAPPDDALGSRERLAFTPLERSVERQATRFIVRCLSDLQLDGLPLPIPVDAWAERPLGIRLEFVDLSRFDSSGSEALGRADVENRVIEIDQRIIDQTNRFRFTVAHELGHIALHSEIDPNDTLFYEGAARRERFERQADRFAAAFLMPVSAFRQECQRLFPRSGRSPATLLQSINAGEETSLRWLSADAVPSLARRFGVARSTALNRFRDLRTRDGKPVIQLKTLQAMAKSMRQAGSTDSAEAS